MPAELPGQLSVRRLSNAKQMGLVYLLNDQNRALLQLVMVVLITGLHLRCKQAIYFYMALHHDY